MYNHTKVHPECFFINYETDMLTRHLLLYKLVLLVHFYNEIKPSHVLTSDASLFLMVQKLT